MIRAALAGLLLAAVPAGAQEYPSRPVTIIVASPALAAPISPPG